MGRNILGNPGANRRDDAIFSVESLLQELERPWELTLTERVARFAKLPVITGPVN